MILIISPKQTSATILDALHGSFAMTRQDSVNLQFDLDAAQLMRFKYALRNAVDVTRLVYVNTEAGLVELDRVKTVADFANQNSLPLVLASAYSLLAEDQCGDFLRSAAGYIEGIVPQHFIIGRAQFENVQFSLIADQINGLSDNGLFGRYHARIAGGGAALDPVTRKDASPYIAKRLDRPGFGS